MLIPMLFITMGLFNQVNAQCIRTSSYGSATVDAGGAVTTISTCNFTSEYSTVNGITTGYTYEFTCTLSGTHKYVTLTDAAGGGNVLAYGPSPLSWQATYTGTVYPNWSDDAACNLTSSCHTTTVQVLLGCENGSQYPASAVTVDPGGSLTTISTCNYAGEYSQVTGIVAGQDYQFTMSDVGTGTFITITDGPPTGANILAYGASPITITATANTDLYVHWNTDDLCGTDASCHTTTVQYLASCPDPSAQIETNITQTSADLGWTENGSATTWEIEWGPTGFTQGSGTMVTGITSNPYNLTGLTAATTYDWYVRADCGGGSYSNWVGPSTFTTLCNAISAFPYTETFDGLANSSPGYSCTADGSVDLSPVCFTNISGDNIDWDIYSGATGSSGTGPSDDITGGGKYLYTEASSCYNSTGAILSPEFDFSSFPNPRLSFSNHMYGSNMGTLTLDVTTNGGTTWTTLWTQSGDQGNQWNLVVLDVSAYGGNASVFFRWTGVTGGGYTSDMAIDQVVIDQLPLDQMDWCNLQWPPNATIDESQNATVYSQGYEPGVTDSPGQGAGIDVWIGYSTTNTNPNTWTNWVSATFNTDVGNNDEYMADLGAAQGLAPGTYYYASRWQLNSGPYTYGGYSSGGGGFWDGSTYVSGVLTINPYVASVPYYQDFSGGVEWPAGWYESGNTAVWSLQQSFGGADYSAYSSYNNQGVDTLFTCPIDATGKSNLHVRFFGYWRADWSGATQDGYFYGMDGTNTYLIDEWHHNNPALEFGFHEYDISSWADGKSNLRFYFALDMGDDYYWVVDYFEVKEGAFGQHGLWTGNTDNDWHTGSNWDDGIVPFSMSTVNINAGLTNYPTINADAYCNNLNVQSTSTGDASLLDNGYLSINSGVSVDRYLSADQYHSFTPSVGSQVAGLFHLPGSTGLDVYLYSNNEATYDYTEIVPVTTPLNTFEGYMVWVDGANATPPVGGWTFTETGGPSDFNTGAFGSADNVTMSDPGGNQRGWNFFGNPYTSAIDWDAASGWTKTDIDGTIYIYNGTQWATYNSGTGGTNGGTQYIAMGQGFFVHKTDLGGPYPETGTLTMDNNVRVHNGVAYLKETIANKVSLKVEGNGYSDETAILFRDDATVGFDSQYDAYKLETEQPGAPTFYSVGTSNLAVNVLPEADWVQLGFKSTVNGTYTISADEINDLGDVVLEDTFTGEMTDLNAGSYTFNYTVGDNEDRFIVHFSPLGVDENESMFDIYSHGKNAYIVVPANTKGNIVVYNMMGQAVASSDITTTRNVIHIENSGNYIVKVMSDNSVVTKKVFIK